MLKHLSILALAGFALAQDSNVPDLATALSSTDELSTLQSVIPASVLEALAGLDGLTILAPSNSAFEKVDNETLTALTTDEGLLTALLQYHVLNGTFLSTDITNTSAFVPTLLTDPMYTNVTGGQVVRAIAMDDSVMFYSGLMTESTVTTADVNFTGGVIHIIDTVLAIPLDTASTLAAADLSALRGAINATNLFDTVNNTPDITIFAPSNEAFQNIGSALGDLSVEDITSILTYHVIAEGGIGYSSTLENGTTLTTANGEEVTVTINDNGVFVNNARVVITDVLLANGVAHVIDEVLNPANAAVADPTAEEGEPAFEGASSVSELPYTSDQPTPTTTLNQDATDAAEPTGTGPTTIDENAAPKQTGAIGMGALFGAAAVYFL